MFQAGWSYVHALTAPGTDPLSARSVEWVRDHGGGGIVNRIEHWWYTNHPPPVGGRPEHGLPRPANPGGEATGKHAKVLNTPPPPAPPPPPHPPPPRTPPPSPTPSPA